MGVTAPVDGFFHGYTKLTLVNILVQVFGFLFLVGRCRLCFCYSRCVTLSDEDIKWNHYPLTLLVDAFCRYLPLKFTMKLFLLFDLPTLVSLRINRFFFFKTKKTTFPDEKFAIAQP